MKDCTLISVNWNQRPAMELMLKSYVKHHYKNEALDLILVDNDSSDDSQAWLFNNEIDFVRCDTNIGHEAALNRIWDMVFTKYCLLVDTDVMFKANVYEYIDLLKGTVVAAGELINNPPMIPRISPWFTLFDMETVREAGMETYREPGNTNHIYDVGSSFTERLTKWGYKHYQVARHSGNQDVDLVSMKYDLFDHIGKVSWNLENHGDRQHEVTARREYILDKLKEFEDIDLKGKFI